MGAAADEPVERELEAEEEQQEDDAELRDELGDLGGLDQCELLRLVRAEKQSREQIGRDRRPTRLATCPSPPSIVTVTASSASVMPFARVYGRRGKREKAENGRMGAVSAALILLADWVTSVQNFVEVFTLVYFLLIFAYILMSWVRLPYSIWLSRIQRFLYDVCEPYLRIFRRLLPPFGPLDLSPIVAIITLWVASQVVVSLLGRLD